MAYTCKTCDQILPPDGVFTYRQKPYCDAHAPFGAVRYGATTAYQCIRCSQLIPNGEVLVFDRQPLCTRCAPGGSKPWNPATVAPLEAAPVNVPVALGAPAGGLPSSVVTGSVAESRGPLTLLGLCCCAIGLVFLLNPEAPVDRSSLGLYESALPGGVANLHKLALGQTFTIVGAIFLAAAWRPR
jgi:hypothetical protein